MHYVLTFFAGAFLCNCIPHLSSGLRGAPFPTPFAKPRGVGYSPPFLNFLWGSFNLFIGIYVLSIYPVVIGPNPACLALVAGVLMMGAYLSLHFGKVFRNTQAK